MSLQRTILPPPRPSMRPDTSLAIVNIVLLLVLFFLTSGALLDASARTDLDVPKSSNLAIERLIGTTLEITADGDLVLNGDLVARDDLDTVLDGEERVYLLMNAESPAATILDLLDLPVFERLDVQLVTLDQSGQP